MAKILIIAGISSSSYGRSIGLIGQKAGHQIYWVSGRKVECPGVIVKRLPECFGHSTFWRVLLEPFLVMEAIRKFRPDLIHVHYAMKGLVTIPLLFFHPLVVSTMGDDINPKYPYHKITVPFARLLLDHADIITSRSDYMDEALALIGNYQSKTRRVTFGIDLEKFHSNRDVGWLRKKLAIPADDIIFFDPRVAKPNYNKHVILGAFAHYLHNGGSAATLLVTEYLADPKYSLQLRHQAQSLGISDHVRFLGAIDLADLPDYFTLADITISIPSTDGLPQTFFEAFACGSFIIAGDLPSYKGVLQNGVTACLVSVNDEIKLAETMQWVVKHPDIRKKAVQLGQIYIQDHADFRKQANLVNQIYSELISI